MVKQSKNVHKHAPLLGFWVFKIPQNCFTFALSVICLRLFVASAKIKKGDICVFLLIHDLTSRGFFSSGNEDTGQKCLHYAHLYSFGFNLICVCPVSKVSHRPHGFVCRPTSFFRQNHSTDEV